MKFAVAIDEYIADMQSEGRHNSPATERDYRGVLYAHLEDVSNRDPRKTGREDIKRTLMRWPHPSSQSKNRSILVAFYDWMVEEGLRETNPARQTRRPKRRPSQRYRMSIDEVHRLLGAVRDERERRAIYLGICVGLRSAELRGLQGRHFERPDFVWVSSDIAKGSRERWVPVPPVLAPLIADLRRTVGPDDFVLASQRWRDPGVNRATIDYRKRPMSAKALWELVRRVGKRAGIAAPIHPHLMRHANADHIAREAGVYVASAMLGHAKIATTQAYLGTPTPDELQKAISKVTSASRLGSLPIPCLEPS